MLQLLVAFIHEGYQVTFVTTASKTPYSDDLSSLGVQTATIALNHESFDVFIQDLQPHVVVFDRFMVEEQFGWRVAENAPQALRILNTEDLHSLRKTRQLAHQKGEGFILETWMQQEMTKREMASIYRSDLTLLVSSYEMKILQTKLNIQPDLLYHLPFLLDTIDEGSPATWPSFKNRKDFICFGNGRHAPNIDAIAYLKKDIWPLIRQQLPEAKLCIFGAYLPQQVQEWHQPKAGFYVQGWVNDLDHELQGTRVNLAPLRFGAGIKGKLTQALQNGTPTITTSIGAEGMFTGEDLPVVVRNDAKSVAQAAIALYQDENEWYRMQSKGVDAINMEYDKKVLLTPFFAKVNTLYQTLSEHRTANFIGSMLQHQTMASTKYMAKWIEEKNR